MKKFREYISEEVVPSALVANGTIDIDNEDVRASINLALAKVTADGAITPYIALNRISKALSYFHIILPKRIYLEGAKGVEVHEIRQFGHKMGMTDQGEFVHEVPGKYYLFMQYGMNNAMPYGGQLAYPNMGGTFRVMAKVVDKIELDRLVSMAELALAEECDAEMQQKRAKMLAPHETMHDVTSDEKKVGNKKAVGVSQKGLDEDKDPCWKGYEMVGMKNKRGRKVPNCVPVKEGILDKLNPFSGVGSAIDKAMGTSGAKAAPDTRIMGNPDTQKKPQPPKEGSPQSSFPSVNEGRMPASVIKHKQKLANMTPEEKAKKFTGKSEEELKSMARRHGYGKDSNEYSKHMKEEQIDEISHKLALRAMKKSEKRSDDEYEADSAYDRLSDYKTHEDRAKRLRGHMRRKFGNDKPGRGNTGVDPLGPDKHDYGIGREKSDRLKHGKRAGLPSRQHITNLKSNIKLFRGKHTKANLPEETLEENDSDRRRKYAQIKLGRAHKGEEGWNDKVQPRAAAIKMGRKLQKKGVVREEQIDEMKGIKSKSAYNRATKQSAAYKMRKKKQSVTPRKEKTNDTTGQLQEKAPPGAKFERMVKHIKAGYAKDGLTKKEKGIAYATAWKAKKRESED